VELKILAAELEQMSVVKNAQKKLNADRKEIENVWLKQETRLRESLLAEELNL
jgi:hypothetical protein